MAEKLTEEEIKILQDKYSLNDEQLSKFFAEEIVPKFTRGKKPSEKPQLVYLSGQPGAGKSSVSRIYAKEMGGEESVVVFGADDLRAMLPYAKEVQEKYEMEYPFITKKDSGKLRTMLMNHCFENKINMVVESIFANPNDDKMPVFEQAKKAGFKMGVAFLGVDENLSSLGIYNRYNYQKNLTGRGFAPTLDMHDKAYAIMPQIITGMTQNPNIDWVKIYDRDGECHGEWQQDCDTHIKYDKQKSSSIHGNYNEWVSNMTDQYTAKLKECTSKLEGSREASFKKDDYEKSMTSYDKIIADMTKREESQELIDTVKKLKDRHMTKKMSIEKQLKNEKAFKKEKREADQFETEGIGKFQEETQKKILKLARKSGIPLSNDACKDEKLILTMLEQLSNEDGKNPEKITVGQKQVFGKKPETVKISVNPQTIKNLHNNGR